MMRVSKSGNSWEVPCNFSAFKKRLAEKVTLEQRSEAGKGLC